VRGRGGQKREREKRTAKAKINDRSHRWKAVLFLRLPFHVSSFEMHMFVRAGLLKPPYWGHTVNKSSGVGV